MTGLAQIDRRVNSLHRVASVARVESIPLRIVIPIAPQRNRIQNSFDRVRSLAAHHSMFWLRLSLAVVFIWFGALKVASASPVVDLLRVSIPFLARTPYLQVLGLAEIVIGLGMIFDRFSRPATFIMMLHLVGTLSLVVLAPSAIFAPSFPQLTMAGEFVLKNVVLITAALVILVPAPPARSALPTAPERSGVRE